MNHLHIEHKRVNILELALFICNGKLVPNWVLCGQQTFFLCKKRFLCVSVVLETKVMLLTQSHVG